MDTTEALRAELVRAVRALGAPEDVEPVIERPRDPAFGDWATNLAMVLAKPLGKKPRDIATAIVERLDHLRAGIRSAEIAGPGFINFRLATDVFAEGLRALIAAGHAYGHSNAGEQCPVNIEFVSANPTGPLHVGHGRQAALGDAISSLLSATGWRVSREFYYNDAGAQIANLALSVQARVREIAGESVSLPEGGYHGEYIRELAQRYVEENASDANAADLDALRRFAVRELRKEQDRDLQAFGVNFDVYFLESSLYEDGRVDDTVRRARRGRAHLRQGRRALAAHDRLRRRQGSRHAQERRDLHVLRAGRGVPRHEVGARVQARHQRAGRRSPQHGDARAGRTAGARRGDPQGLPGLRAAPDGDGHARRRGGEDLQARRQLRHRARSRRRGRTRRGSLLLPHAEGRLAARVRRRPRALAVGRESRLLHPDGARAHVGHFPRGRDRPGVGHRRRRGPLAPVCCPKSRS